MNKKRVPQAGLFDDPEEWREVPQALFLSWSPAMQSAYCARRDIDSAIQAEEAGDVEWQEFFEGRAAMYLKMAEGYRVSQHPGPSAKPED